MQQKPLESYKFFLEHFGHFVENAQTVAEVFCDQGYSRFYKFYGQTTALRKHLAYTQSRYDDALKALNEAAAILDASPYKTEEAAMKIAVAHLHIMLCERHMEAARSIVERQLLPDMLNGSQGSMYDIAERITSRPIIHLPKDMSLLGRLKHHDASFFIHDRGDNSLILDVLTPDYWQRDLQAIHDLLGHFRTMVDDPEQIALAADWELGRLSSKTQLELEFNDLRWIDVPPPEQVGHLSDDALIDHIRELLKQHRDGHSPFHHN